MQFFWLLTILSSQIAYSNSQLPTPSQKACSMALGGANTQARTKTFLSNLPPSISKLFRGVLAEGAQFTAADLSAVGEFSSNVLKNFSEDDRKIIYRVLDWPDTLSAHAEKSINDYLQSPKGWATEASIALGKAIRSTALVTGYLGLGITGSYLAYNQHADSENEKEKKKTFSPFYEEDFEEKLFKKLRIAEGLKDLPKNFTYNGVKYKKSLQTDTITGGKYALYELVSGNSHVKQIEVHEDKVRNVHSGYSVILISDKEKQFVISTDKHREEYTSTEEKSPLTPELYVSIMAKDKSLTKKSAPKLAQTKLPQETEFDKKYSRHFKLEASGVAIIDTGIDYTRSDLVSRALTNNKEIPQNGIDDDNNGLVDDYLGYDFVTNSFNTHSPPSAYHGSFVADVATQASSRIKAMPFINRFELSNSDLEFKLAVDYIKKWNQQNPQKRIRVINLSFGSGNPLSPNLVDSIRNNPDLIFVASAGNNMNGIAERHSFPAEYNFSNVINVGATDESGKLAIFSGSGPNIDVVAPGQNIPLKNSNGEIEKISGTSFSAPHVAGIIARMILLKPDLSVEEIRKILSESQDISASPNSALDEGVDFELRGRFQQAAKGPIHEDKAFQSILNMKNK